MAKTPDFELSIIRQHWISDDGRNDLKDLCSHGELNVRIGSEVLSDAASGPWTLSAAGLFLLRSLDQDCESSQFENFMIPCCGHAMYPGPNPDDPVVIVGCNRGLDWQIVHTDRSVRLTSRSSEAVLPFATYRNAVLDFVTDVKAFYGDPGEKIVPDEDVDAFRLFWSEWNLRVDRWTKPA